MIGSGTILVRRHVNFYTYKLRKFVKAELKYTVIHPCQSPESTGLVLNRCRIWVLEPFTFAKTDPDIVPPTITMVRNSQALE